MDPAQRRLAANQGLIGDGRGWALVGHDGGITRMHIPESGGPALFNERDRFIVRPHDLRVSRQYYLPDTNVLVTEMHCSTGVVELTDTFTLHPRADLAEQAPAARRELLRYVRVLSGTATLDVSIAPSQPVQTDWHDGELRLRCSAPGTGPYLITDRPLTELHTTTPVRAGEDMWFLLRWWPDGHRVNHRHPRQLLDETAAAWRRWSQNIAYQGPLAETVRRSALVLKLLGQTDPAGTAGTAFALRSVGLSTDADRLLTWILGTIKDTEDTTADLHGELLDCAFQWSRNGREVDGVLWAQLSALADAATPALRAATYDAAMCQVALDRATRMHTGLCFSGRPPWHAAALRDRILHEAWDETRQSLTEYLGPGGELDPRLLALPLRHVVQADHPRMAATTRAISERLTLRPGLVAQGSEVNLPYSFWYADNLLGQGRIDEAGSLYEQLCGGADSLGLLPERVVPEDGRCAGRFPHPATHVAVISTGTALAKAVG